MPSAVVYNPAPFAPGLEEQLSLASIVVVNEEEFSQMRALVQGEGTTTAVPAPVPATSSSSRKDAKVELEMDLNDENMPACMSKLGIKTAVVTRGRRGASLYMAREDPRHIPAYNFGPAVDSTGAGDAFCGALAYFLTLSGELPAGVEAVHRASCGAAVVASLSVTREGAQVSYPSRTDLRALCVNYPEVKALFMGPQGLLTE